MNTQPFHDAVGRLAASFGWQPGSFARDGDFVAVAPLNHDPSFEQIIWILGDDGEYVRCLLVYRGSVPAQRKDAIIELCARINDGLVFACAEYSFDEGAVSFRGSAEIGSRPINELIEGVTGRVLGVASRCAPAVRAVLAGSTTAEAMKLLSTRNES